MTGKTPEHGNLDEIYEYATKPLADAIMRCLERFAPELFRRSISICNPHIPAGNALPFRNPKINQYQAVIIRYHNIGRLQIAVYNWRFQMVQIMQHLRKLYAPVANLPFLNWSAGRGGKPLWREA